MFTECKPKNRGELNIQVAPDFVVMDSTVLAGRFRPFKYEDQQAFYPVYYLGKKQDTLVLGKQAIPFYETGERGNFLERFILKPNPGNMRIQVYNGINLVQQIQYAHYSLDAQKRIMDSTDNCFSQALVIYNTGTSPLFLGYGNCLENLRKQLFHNDLGWVDIEKPFSFECATGLRILLLDTNEILLAKMIRYKGSKEYRCRLIYQNEKDSVCSNEFIDRLDFEGINLQKNK